MAQAVFLATWSDMIIFDYITGNLDRLVNHMYNLHASDKNALSLPIHNLKQTREGEIGIALFMTPVVDFTVQSYCVFDNTHFFVFLPKK